MREFASFVLQIYGQNQHQTLLKRKAQQQWLNNFAHHNALLDKIRGYYHQWKSIQSQLDQLNEQSKNRDHELSLLRYQFEELEQANLQENEWKSLSHQHQQLHNAQSLIEKLTQAVSVDLTVKNDEISASMLLQQAIDRVNEIKMEDAQLKSIKEMLSTAAIYLQEAGTELDHYRDRLNLSAENLEALESRLSLLRDLSRKHHVTPNELVDVKKLLEQRIAVLKNIEEHIRELNRRQLQAKAEYEITAEELTQGRKKRPKFLKKRLRKKQHLGMTNGRFSIQFETKLKTNFSAR